MLGQSIANPVLTRMPAAGSLIDSLSDNQLDWIMYALLAFIFGGILAGVGLYLRTAYRSGGWKRVGRDLGILIGVLALWGLKAVIRQFLK